MEIKISSKKANEIYLAYCNNQMAEDSEIFDYLNHMAKVVQGTNFPYVIINEKEFYIMRNYL